MHACGSGAQVLQRRLPPARPRRRLKGAMTAPLQLALRPQDADHWDASAIEKMTPRWGERHAAALHPVQGRQPSHCRFWPRCVPSGRCSEARCAKTQFSATALLNEA